MKAVLPSLNMAFLHVVAVPSQLLLSIARMFLPSALLSSDFLSAAFFYPHFNICIFRPPSVPRFAETPVPRHSSQLTSPDQELKLKSRMTAVTHLIFT